MKISTKEFSEKNKKPYSTCYCDRLDEGQKCLLCQELAKGNDCFNPNELAKTKKSIVVTGTNGKSTITNVLGTILAKVYGGVGHSSTTGLYSAGKQIYSKEHIASQHYLYLLNKQEYETVVCEQPITGIWMFGLPIDHSWGIVTNITNDHTEMNYIKNGMDDIYAYKSLVAKQSLKGVITSVDYPLTRKLVDEFKDKKFYLYGLDQDFVHEYVHAGFKVLTVKDGNIIELTHDKEKEIAKLKDFAICYGGILTYNVENILPIISLILNDEKFSKDQQKLIDELKKFETNFKSNPARFNIFKYHESYVVLDYAHNEAGYESSLTSLDNLKNIVGATETIGLVAVAENRSDENLSAISKTIKKYLNEVKIRWVEGNDNLLKLSNLLHLINQFWEQSYADFVKKYAKSGSIIYITIAGRCHIEDLAKAINQLGLKEVTNKELMQ